MLQQLIRFLFTGGLATALQYIVLGIGTNLLDWSSALSSGMGYLAGSVLSYIGNYFFTFGSNRPHRQAVMRFYLMVAIGWAINTSVMALTADTMNWNKWLSQILATLLTLAWNFSASRCWVFRYW